jgi:hypothetical protein
MRDARIIMLIGAIGAALVAISTEGLEVYGWMLFVVSPFFLGYVAGAVAGERGKTAIVGFSWGGLALVAVAVLLLLFALEGAICLVMASPLALAMVAVGNWVAFAWRRLPPRSHVRLSSSMLALAPLAMFIESGLPPEPELHSVSSVIEIDAPPQTVWRNVTGFSELPPPQEAIFRLGLAYPIRAELEGEGVGAVRRCVFSTGAFVEPITVWDEPRRLAFTVEQNPPPMVELSPYEDIHPPHLDGYFWSERGQFELEPLPDGRTRLIGTTWYRQRLWPAAYWLPWSDYVIHKIHLRVLLHIELRSERDAGR